jgi:anaerobic dimethyl sulfoxide reductase subunit A
MKRKNWEPGGGKKELRGRDEWERISWDEALDLVADELKRIKTKYGNKAILNATPMLCAYGGGVTTWGMVSYGAWPAVNQHMRGIMMGGTNDRMDYRKTKLIVQWGNNTIWSSGGNPTYNYLQAKKAGARFVFVTPMYNDSAQVLADYWVPCRPSTDAALLMGIAYYMIVNNLQDQAFLDKYTLGFDAEHMPDGADPKENFKDYVLGTYDGIPKTPEWAAAICGTPPDLIRQFAQDIATTKPMIFSGGWAPARTYMGEQFCQAFLTVGWMTGNLGKPGAAVCNISHGGASYGGSALVRSGGKGTPSVDNPIKGIPFGSTDLSQAKDSYAIVWDEVWDAVVNGEFTLPTVGKVPCDIRMIWNVTTGSGGNTLNQLPNTVKGIEAYRKVEFVVSADITLSTKSKYADIVLPATTEWEKPGSLWGFSGGEALYFAQKVTEPLYEAKHEIWIERELAKRLDLDPDTIHPLTLEQQLFNQLAGATVIKDDSSGYEPLLTITATDIAEMGVEGEPQTGRITYQEFKQKGIYQIPRSPNDKFGYVAYKEFVDDPEANPLQTVSGKLHIHSQPLSDNIAGYLWTTTPPIAQYRPPLQGIEDTYADWENKVKGEFPLQLLTTHYGRRSHSIFDNVEQLRRAFPEPLWINPVDAEERGIKNGDTVLVTNPHGKVLRPAYVTNKIMPTVVDLGQGAWVDMDDEAGIDKGGCTNVLAGTTPTGQGVQPWNTNICQVEKWSGDPLVPDYKWPRRIIFEEEA